MCQRPQQVLRNAGKGGKSKSSENSTCSPPAVTTDDSNASNSIIIKPEPEDDDLEIIDSEETGTMSNNTLPAEISSSFVGFGDMSSQSFDTDPQRNNSDSLVADPNRCFY